MASGRAADGDGAPRILRFGVADETAWDAGLSCGGEIEILTEPFCGERKERLMALVHAVESRRARILLTRLPDGAQILLSPDPEENQVFGRDNQGKVELWDKAG